jgi:hypothetical protein
VDKVEVKVGDTSEERDLLVLLSQMKQALMMRLQNDVSALAQQKRRV